MVQYGPKYRGVQPGRSRQRVQKPYTPDSGDMARALLFQTLGQVASGATGELLSKGGALRRAITPAETLEAEAAARQAGLAGKRATTRKTQAEAYDIGERGRLRQGKHELGHREESGRTFRQAMGDRSKIDVEREKHRLEKDMLKHKRALKGRGTGKKGVWVQTLPEGKYVVITDASLKSARNVAKSQTTGKSLNIAESTKFMSQVDEGAMRNEGFVRFPNVKAAQKAIGRNFLAEDYRDPISHYGYSPRSAVQAGGGPANAAAQALEDARNELAAAEARDVKRADLERKGEVMRGERGKPIGKGKVEEKFPEVHASQERRTLAAGESKQRLSVARQRVEEAEDLAALVNSGSAAAASRIAQRIVGGAADADSAKAALVEYVRESPDLRKKTPESLKMRAALQRAVVSASGLPPESFVEKAETD